MLPTLFLWLGTYNFYESYEVKENMMVACNFSYKSITEDNVVGLTGNHEIPPVSSCSRYNGPCSFAWQCKKVCYNYGFHRYAWYPTLSLCCCDCDGVC